MPERLNAQHQNMQAGILMRAYCSTSYKHVMLTMQAPAIAPAGAGAQAMWFGVTLGLLHALLVISR